MKKLYDDEVKLVREDDCVESAKSAFFSIALIVGVLTILIGIIVIVSKYVVPKYLDDYDDFDDFDDDFDDDFFDEDENEVEVKAEEEK